VKDRVRGALVIALVVAYCIAIMHDFYYLRTARPHEIGWCLQ